MLDSHGAWDLARLNECLAPVDIERIQRVDLPDILYSYQRCWMLDKKMVFSVKSTYWFSKQQDRSVLLGSSDMKEHGQLWSDIWGIRFCPRFKIWLWRGCWSRLPSAANLGLRGIHLLQFCCFCINQIESIEHLFFYEYPFFLKG